MNKINDDGLNLIKKSEGFSGRAYPDPGTRAEPFTIGYGTTVYPNGQKVKLGDVCTHTQADEYLRHDVAKFETGVSHLVTVPLTDNQFSALVCFAYNVGLGNLQSSTVLKKLNAGDYQSAADHLLDWNKAAGRVLAGLTTRRKNERSLFLR